MSEVLDDDYPPQEWEDTVGASSVGPYDVTAATMRPCPNCGAPEGIKCTGDGPRGRYTRHMPCLARLQQSPVHEPHERTGEP